MIRRAAALALLGALALGACAPTTTYQGFQAVDGRSRSDRGGPRVVHHSGDSPARILVVPEGCLAPHGRFNWLPRAAKVAVMSKYSSNFRRRLPYLRVCHLTCDFSACYFASFGAVDRRLTERRRNRCSQGLVLVAVHR